MASITDSVLVASPPDVVWSVITDPEQVPLLDRRVSLLSTSGEQSTRGSGYVLRVSRGSRSIDTLYRVTEAVAPSMLSMDVLVSGRDPGSQEATLHPEGEGTRLMWTTRISTPFGTAAIARRLMSKDMRAWLDAVAERSAALR